MEQFWSVRADARAIAARTGATIEVVHDPVEAVEGAHVIYSDAFYSMGQEEEAVQRRKDFAPFQISSELLAAAEVRARILIVSGEDVSVLEATRAKAVALGLTVPYVLQKPLDFQKLRAMLMAPDVRSAA